MTVQITAFVLASNCHIEGSLVTHDRNGNFYKRPFEVNLPTVFDPKPGEVAMMLLDPVIETYQFAFDTTDRNLHGWTVPFDRSGPGGVGMVLEFDFDDPDAPHPNETGWTGR